MATKASDNIIGLKSSFLFCYWSPNFHIFWRQVN
jgi:hypothetical protein